MCILYLLIFVFFTFTYILGYLIYKLKQGVVPVQRPFTSTGDEIDIYFGTR